MNQPHQLELRGCTPEPLMAYLKALGIFRIVAEQKDRGARAFWQNDAFFLRSALDREALGAILSGRIPAHSNRIPLERRQRFPCQG